MSLVIIKEMIRPRNNSEYAKTLTYGDFKAIETEEDIFICYSRYDEQYEIIILINFGAEMIVVPDELKDGKVLLNNRMEKDEILHSYQAIVMVREK